jgi:PAS domain S-box-containing protein
MTVVYILSLSIAIQIIAAYFALRLIPVTGARRAWVLISTGIFLMIVRRCISLFELFQEGGAYPVDPSVVRLEEWIALLTSIFMLAGIAMIAPLFHSSRRSAQVVKESEERYRSVFDESRDAIYIADGEGRLIDVNRSTLDLFGYSREEMIGLDTRALYVDNFERSQLRDELRAQGYARDHEMRLRKKNGEVMHCILTATVRRNADGAVQGYQGIVRNITQRRQMEESLRENNKILNAVLAASPIGICLIRDGVFDWVNEAMHRMLGYDVNDLKGKSSQLVYPDAREYERAMRKLHFSESRSSLGCVGGVDTQWIKKGGSLFHCYLQAAPLESDRSSSQQVWAVMDITDLKQAEEALRESEERYRSFFYENLTGVYISTPDGDILACNPAFARIFGFKSVEEALQFNTRALYTSPEARRSFLQLLRIRKKLEYHQHQLKRYDGKLLHIIENAVGKFNEQGELIEVKGYVFDNTELKSLEEQLLHSQKMEAIGRLAGGIAHDFNNLLTAITGYTDLMLMKIPEDDPLHHKAEEIKRAAERATALTRQLLTFSRKQVLQPKVLNLNAVISEMEKLLQRLIGEDVNLLTVLDPGIGAVKTDPGQIEQVIMNLAVNARDAMPEGGRLTIETINVELDEAYARGHVDIIPGPYVMLAVSDTGVGMDAETIARVFEPFFTTKARDKGTGLGLATVYGIIKQSGGHIWVYSELGRGTTFKIYLPRVEEDICYIPPSKQPDECLEGWETILLVEDDEMVRSIISESLRLNGYTVLVARQGDEASRICAEYDGPIHLMVTDVVMPGMNGRELAERLAPERPEMKCLFMSGYTDKSIVHNGVLEPGTAFLQKPFRLEALLQKAREVLDRDE